tara:strand:+ start:1096 stop:1275 length:180 start_codon:yes stop_codon:yes gene_type:complete
MGVKDKWGKPRKWIIYYDKKDKIKEVKSLYKAEKYTGSRPLYSDKEIIKILTNEKLKGL